MTTPVGQTTRRMPSLDGLSSTAKTLSDASRKLNEAVESLEDALKKLNLGITAWLQTRTCAHEYEVNETEEIGYARHKGTWGICIRQTIEGHDPEPQETIWYFADAPRVMRIRNAEYLNQLVGRIDEIGKETAQKLTEHVAAAEELALAIDAIADTATKAKAFVVKGGQK